MKRITITVNEETIELLKVAKKAGFNNSSLFRVAIENYIKNELPKLYEEYEKTKEE